MTEDSTTDSLEELSESSVSLQVGIVLESEQHDDARREAYPTLQKKSSRKIFSSAVKGWFKKKQKNDSDSDTELPSESDSDLVSTEFTLPGALHSQAADTKSQEDQETNDKLAQTCDDDVLEDRLQELELAKCQLQLNEAPAPPPPIIKPRQASPSDTPLSILMLGKPASAHKRLSVRFEEDCKPESSASSPTLKRSNHHNTSSCNCQKGISVDTSAPPRSCLPTLSLKSVALDKPKKNAKQGSFMFHIIKDIVLCPQQDRDTNRRFQVDLNNTSLILKSIRPDLETQRHKVLAAQALQKEAVLLAQLQHPNIARAWAICSPNPTFHVDPELSVVMEEMKKSLPDRLFGIFNSNLKIHRRFEICTDLAEIVRYLHSHRILHGDLRPSSFAFDNDGTLKLTRLETAQILPVPPHGAAQVVTKRPYIGSAPYIAPEVGLRNRGGLSSDIFVLSMTLYQVITLEEPYPDIWTEEYFDDVLLGGCRPTIRKSVPEELRILLEACWDAFPMRRPTIAEVYERLKAMKEAQPMCQQNRRHW